MCVSAQKMKYPVLHNFSKQCFSAPKNQAFVRKVSTSSKRVKKVVERPTSVCTTSKDELG